MASVSMMSPILQYSDAPYALERWWWQWERKLYQYRMDDYFLNPTSATSVLSIFLVFATAVTIARWWRWSRRERPPLPPGPRGLPLVGSLPFIGTELHRSFAKMAETYGPIMKLQLGGKLCVVVTSPLLAKEIFKDQDTIFANHDVLAVGAIATYGGVDMVWSPYGDHWRMLRKVCVSEMLNQKRLEALYGLRRRELRHTVNQLYSKAGSPVDVGEQMFLTTFNVITSMLWGDTLEGEEGQRATAEVRRIMDKVVLLFGEPNISDLFPALAWLDIQGIGRRMKKTISWFDRMLDSVIDERLKREIENVKLGREGNHEDGKQTKDLLQALLQRLNLKYKDGDPDNTTTGLTISHIKQFVYKEKQLKQNNKSHQQRPFTLDSSANSSISTPSETTLLSASPERGKYDHILETFAEKYVQPKLQLLPSLLMPNLSLFDAPPLLSLGGTATTSSTPMLLPWMNVNAASTSSLPLHRRRCFSYG